MLSMILIYNIWLNGHHFPNCFIEKEYDSIIRRYMREIISDESVSLTELAKQYSDESPGYVIQSWMRSRNTLEFLRLWENEMNSEFNDVAWEELI